MPTTSCQDVTMASANGHVKSTNDTNTEKSSSTKKDVITEVNIDNIKASYEKRIKSFVHKTAVLTCNAMSQKANEVAGRNDIKFFLKTENVQKIGAFKIRGAVNAVSLSDADVITTHSSGNHAQAIALACQELKKKAIIVMPKDSPISKVNAVRDTYKAEIRFCEPIQAARESLCEEVMAECDSKNLKSELIHPYDDKRVCCGQGSVALELVEQAKEFGLEKFDAVIISVGGGGLLGGCATVLKHYWPDCKVIAAEPQEASDCWESFYGQENAGKFDIQKTQAPLSSEKRLRANHAGKPKTIADS